MKHFKQILEDKDYILSEEQKFLERDCNISHKKYLEMKQYYDAYNHEIGMMEDGEWEFLELTQEMIDKRKAMIHEIQESGLEFALRRMTGVITIGKTDIYDFVYFFERAKDDQNCYFRMLDFVNYVNAYWDITDEKAPNRVAWGWNQYHKKESPMGFLYGCVRNYLKRNDKFDKDEFNRIWFGRLG